MAHNSKLSIKQSKMINALIYSRNIGDACKKVGIGRSTLARWKRQEEFSEALNNIEQEYNSNISSELILGQIQAIDTLRGLMENASSETVKRQAANDWLSHTVKIRELVSIEKRLTKLEESKDANQ